MGLDLLEFFIEVERVFDVVIPDQIGPSLTTPGHLIDYIANVLPVGDDDHSLQEIAFAKLQRAVSIELSLPNPCLTSSTSLCELLSGKESAWTTIGQRLGAVRWPKLKRKRWFVNRSSPSVETVNDALEFIVENIPGIAKASGEGWSRNQIAEVVKSLVVTLLPIGRDDYKEELRFIEDIGLR